MMCLLLCNCLPNGYWNCAMKIDNIFDVSFAVSIIIITDIIHQVTTQSLTSFIVAIIEHLHWTVSIAECFQVRYTCNKIHQFFYGILKYSKCINISNKTNGCLAAMNVRHAAQHLFATGFMMWFSRNRLFDSFSCNNFIY